MKTFTFDSLRTSDLIVDASYKSGPSSNWSDEPINRIIPVGNQGGFRYMGSVKNKTIKYVMLYTTLRDLDWHDQLDKQTGQFIYYGDNKKPGSLIHDTKGNQVLRDVFNYLHTGQRNKIPPFFVFSKGVLGRDVSFVGLAVPGAKGISSMDDLVAVWKLRSNERFQNYRSTFTILDIPVVSRAWLDDLGNGNPFSRNCPKPWKDWIDRGTYSPLFAERIVEYRSKEEQIPNAEEDRRLIEFIYRHYESNPYGFEKCAAEVVRLMDKNFISYDLTRPWQDGGRDAIGKFRIGSEENGLIVDYAIEAKCYKLNLAVGVKGTSRLVSRLKYRQFGVFVTTSYVHKQAYKEIKDDGHPVLIISSQDIVNILKRNGISTVTQVNEWINSFEK